MKLYILLFIKKNYYFIYFKIKIIISYFLNSSRLELELNKIDLKLDSITLKFDSTRLICNPNSLLLLKTPHTLLSNPTLSFFQFS